VSLRNRARVIGATLPILWLVVELFYGDKFGVTWALFSGLSVIIGGILLVNLLARRSLLRFRRALSIEDIPTASRELADLTDFWRLRGRAVMEGYQASILLVEERYTEARNGLRALEAKKLSKRNAAVIQNQIAWCTLHLDEPTKAIEIAQSVLPQLESLGPAYGSSGHLVLGAANFLLGRHTEAVSHLEKAYAGSTDSPSRKSTAAFYLGGSLSALCKHNDAREAFQHAYEALPSGRYGIRASERLK